MDNMKRFVSFLLCFVMLLGFLPVNARAVDATETPLDAIVVFSDLHIGTKTNDESGKATTLKAVLNQIKSNVGTTVTSVNSAGDMFSSNEGTVDSNTDNLNGYIREVFRNVPVNYVWTDHDRNASDISKKSGLVKYDNYYVYTLSMGDLSSNDRYRTGFAYSESNNSNRVSSGFTATVPQAIEAFQAAVANLDKNKPLFIVGHQPLFDCRNDNAWAEDWVAAINEVAEEMDVTYFFGHNHAHDYKNTATGKKDYYFAKGSSMPVPKRSDWGFNYNEGSQSNKELGYTNVTLNFTHVCAGYMDPGTTSTTTRKGTALAVEIYDDHIDYTIYDKNGVYSGADEMELDVTVERKNKVSGITPIEDTIGNTGITVAAEGVSVVEAAVNETPWYDTSVYTAYASYEIAVGGDYMDGTEATVTIPAPSYFDLSKPAVVLDKGVQIAVDTNIRDGITFTTTHFSTYDVAQTAVVQNVEPLGSYQEVTVTPADDVTTYNPGWITFKEYVEAVEGKKQNKYVLDTDGIDTGVDYLIVNTGTAGTGYALTNNSGTAARTEVTISNNEILMDTDKTANIVWQFSGTSSGTVSNNGRYLNPENGALELNTSGTTLTFSNQKAGAYRLYRTEPIEIFGVTIGYHYFYVRYNSNMWTGGRTEYSSYMTSVHLYSYAGEVTTDGTPAVDGLYGKIKDDSTMTVNVPNGTSADDALAAVKVAVDVEYKLSPEGTVQTCADSDVTWTLDPNYNGKIGGDYAVTISYQGKTLGIAEVVVDSASTYYGAVGLKEITVDMGTTAGMAMTAVKEAVTIYSATDAQGSNATAISDSSVTWEWVGDPNYNANRPGPYTVEIKADNKSLGTVEVHVNVSYGEDEGESNEVEVGGTPVTKTVYVLTNTIQSNKSYLIVNSNSAGTSDKFALKNNNGSITATGVEIKSGNIDSDTDNEIYIELDNANAELWTFSAAIGSSTSSTIKNGSHYLYSGRNGGLSLQTSTGNYTNWRLSGNSLYRYRSRYTSYYLQYNNGWTTTSSSGSATAVYFYIPTTVTMGGSTTYTMSAEGLDQYLTMDSMSAKLNYALLANDNVADPLPGSADGYDFEPVNDRNNIIDHIDADGTIHFTGATGTAQVRVSYAWTQDGQSYEVYKYVTVNTTAPNNYPEYPNEGAVKVNKTGTGIDFQKTGIAQVEISASGVPMSKGTDVIVMLDTSSSMNSNKVKDDSGNTTNKTRLQVLQEALDAMVEDFQQGGPNGEELDIRLAIADFNGYYDENSGTPYDQDENDYHGNSSYDQDANDKVYTGDGTLTAGAFVNVNDITTVPKLTYTSGTNYDYAFDAIYQLGTAIKAENEMRGETRNLYVIFMSDGAAFQWNYYHSRNNQGNWGKWITGQYTTTAQVQSAVNCDTHYYYYDFVDHDNDGQYNEHRMANAIKGDPNKQYEIIRKTDEGLPEGTLTPVLKENGSAYANLYTVPGLGATMFTINFDSQTDGSVQQADIRKSLKSTASDQTGSVQYYYEINTISDLGNAFDTIGSDMAYAAYNARFVDQMGKDYDLQMKPLTDLNGNLLPLQDARSKIEVIEYEIYGINDTIPAGKKIGDRKVDASGNLVYKVIETVTFEYSVTTNAENEKVYTVTGAYSSLLGEEDILGADGIIRAKNFYYNTTNKGVAIEGLDIPTGVDENNLTTGTTNVLPAESFYWGMGTVKTTELALRYYVYLTGSMEGTREAGSYPTNNYANLYYDNYVGNPCHKDTVSPVLPWKEANVSYAFYLVDEQGRIVVNQTTGQTGSFANKIAVTNPVVHSTIKLNSSEDVDAAEVAASGVLPEGYTLYDAVYDTNGNILTGATYTVEVDSDGSGKWDITGPKNDNTTYVMQFNPGNSADYSNVEHVSDRTNDYSHTVVWFAVVWKIQPLPDTVVVDYGLPVDISVLVNDMFGDHGKLAGVGSMKTEGLVWDGHTANNLLSTNPYKGTYGTATVNTATGKVRYSLETMEMNSHEQFAYAVNYTGNENAGYYYETVTVIPATTIYYEDSFVEYDSFTWDKATNKWGAYVPKDVNGDGKVDNSLWSVATDSEDHSNAVQGEDRPGKYALTDANNIYGYDGVNLSMSQYSLGSAHKATVDYDNYASAQFTFYGTGFDIISMTDTTTGTILVEVEKQDANGAWSKFHGFSVDTYYGYKQIPGDADNNGEIGDGEMIWVVDPAATGSIYQVPVIKMADKPYGHYRVTIKATYESYFDHVAPSNTTGSYDFYLDAIRIYDPANDGEGNKVIEDAYVADGEGWPSYIELRNGLIAAGSFDGVANDAMDNPMTGLVFIDGDPEVDNAQLSDYVSFGPNNEIYLAPGQRVAFLLNTPENIANIHIGLSQATVHESADTAEDAKPIVTYTITNIAQNRSADGKVNAGDYYNHKTFSLDTTTDMYYDLTAWKGDIIVISNTGDRTENKTSGVLSITNIKSTYKTNPNGSNSNVVVPEKPEEGTEEAEVQNLTSIYMTPRAAKLVLETLNAQENTQTPDAPTVPDVPEITEVFEPKLFHVKLNKDEIKQGQKVLVTVTTSADVEYIMINGVKVTNFVAGSTGNRTWKLNVTGDRVGSMTVEVVCCNSKGVASEPVTEKIKVKAKGLLGSLDDIFR